MLCPIKSLHSYRSCNSGSLGEMICDTSDCNLMESLCFDNLSRHNFLLADENGDNLRKDKVYIAIGAQDFHRSLAVLPPPLPQQKFKLYIRMASSGVRRRLMPLLYLSVL